MPNDTGLTIGEVASRADRATSAIRYYERAGLLRPSRGASGRRVYDEDVFERLELIFLAQDAGFTIAETRALLHGFDSTVPASERWRALGREKIVELTRRIERAERMRALLQRLMRCECRTLSECVASRKRALAAAKRAR
jgi:MerR family redox-sensitive transcriptional activator SoxR